MRKLYSTIPMNALARVEPFSHKRARNEEYDDGTNEETRYQRHRKHSPRQRPIDIYDNDYDIWRM